MTAQSKSNRAALSAGLVGALVGLLTTGTAGAQDQDDSEGIQTVTVTANRVVEDAQKVPIAVAALSAELADQIGVDNGQTLAQAVPGLMMNRQTNGSQVFMRGIGTSSTQAGNEPAVAMYVDGVYYGTSAAALGNYSSVDRIEVLKGPQGTLFGRNATGGVVQVFTKDPSEEAAFDISLGYGNYQTIGGSVYATGALSDNLSANLTLYSEKQHDGWGDNLNLGIPTYRQSNHGARAKLKWQAGEKTTIIVNADLDDYFNQQAVYFRPAPGTFAAVAAGGASVSVALGRPPVPSLSVPPSGRYDTREALDPIAAVKMFGGSVKISHEFDWGRLVSLTAYRNSDAVQDFEQDGASIYRQNPHLEYHTKTYTQELQLIGGEGTRFQWQGGIFLMQDESVVDPFTFRGIGAGGSAPLFLAALGARTDQDLDSYAGYFQGNIAVGDKGHITAGVRYTEDKREIAGGRINTNAAGALSGYAPATNDGVSASWSSVTWRLAYDHQFTDDVMGYVAANTGFKAGLFNSILGPAPTSATTGSPPQPTHDPPVSPEEIDAYSIGLKSQWLNDRVRLNIEGYYYDYTGLQMQAVVSVPGSTLTFTRLTNVAAATVKGVDVEAIFKPTRNLTLNLGLNFMDAKYDDFPNGQYFVTNPLGGNCALVPMNTGGCVAAGLPSSYNATTGTWNLAGNDMVQAPEFTGNLSATYTAPLSNGSELAFTLHWHHNADYWAEPANGGGQINTTVLPDPFVPGSTSCSYCVNSSPNNEKQQAIDLINATVQWNSQDDKYSVRLWGKNLSGEEYWSFNNSTATVTKQVPAPPRTYGITFIARY